MARLTVDNTLFYGDNPPILPVPMWLSTNGLPLLLINNQLPRDRWLEYAAVFQGLR
jgi:hypothetical protein